MVIVLNFGSQFAHLIARRVRDLGVKAEILPFDATIEQIQSLGPQGIILSGSPASVLDKHSFRPRRKIFDLGIPILGICYGHQVMASMLGGKVEKGKIREFGKEKIRVILKQGIFAGLGKEETVWFSHGDQVSRLPEGFVRTASTAHCKNAGMQHKNKPFYSIQFHPEVAHTVHGTEILKNFLFKICNAKRDWNIGALKEKIIVELRRTIGDAHAVIGISGGVDSLVAGVLLKKAIGKRLHPIFIDTGLLRLDEGREVERDLRKLGFYNLATLPAERIFLARLRGIADPEGKRKIIGHTFINVFERAIKGELSRYPVRYFAQGTIYPDRVESAATSKHAAKIKSHHNLTIPEKFGFEILEPLEDLYKDEVRKLGVALGLPREKLFRHPFPGPGLAVRILGEVTKEKLEILRKVDSIYLDELRVAGEYDRIWQAFAVLLPAKSVGVMGDARTYEYIVSLRAVDSVDGMTADWHKMPNELLERISSRIVGEVRGVNRVLYDITQKPPGTIEYE